MFGMQVDYSRQSPRTGIMWHKSPRWWSEYLFPSDSRARFGFRPNGIKHYRSTCHSSQRPFTFSEDWTMRLRLSWEAKFSSFSLKKSFLCVRQSGTLLLKYSWDTLKFFLVFFLSQQIIAASSEECDGHVTVKSYTGSVQCLPAWRTGLFLQHTVLLCTYEYLAEDFDIFSIVRGRLPGLLKLTTKTLGFIDLVLC